jgi:hypothetical protein
METVTDWHSEIYQCIKNVYGGRIINGLYIGEHPPHALRLACIDPLVVNWSAKIPAASYTEIQAYKHLEIIKLSIPYNVNYLHENCFFAT